MMRQCDKKNKTITTLNGVPLAVVNKMKNKKTYYNVRNVPKSNSKIMETQTKSIPLAHTYDTTMTNYLIVYFAWASFLGIRTKINDIFVQYIRAALKHIILVCMYEWQHHD